MRLSGIFRPGAATTSPVWFKGNIHTHTNRSDGDSDPDVVVDWYRRNGYDFLVLTDHNHVTILEHSVKGGSGLLLIPGEEVSVELDHGEKSIHLGAIGISGYVEPVDAGEVVPTLQANVNAIRDAGGIVSLNHPNYTWAYDDRHIVRVSGANLLEIFNGNTVVNNYGGGGRPGCEEIWDAVLTAGRPIYGVAVDDSHHFQGDFKPSLANPGRGWVAVDAATLERDAVVSALESGEFYCSTGVTLDELNISEDGIELSICPEWHFTYDTEFVTRGGRVRAAVNGTRARYDIRGDEGYVRARVLCSDGTRAWTQPIFPS